MSFEARLSRAAVWAMFLVKVSFSAILLSYMACSSAICPHEKPIRSLELMYVRLLTVHTALEIVLYYAFTIIVAH